MYNVIDVCDREADMYEYLTNQISHNNRFVVRAYEKKCRAIPDGIFVRPPRGRPTQVVLDTFVKAGYHTAAQRANHRCL